MHIPAAMLNGAVCPVTIAVSAVGITAAVVAAKKTKNKPSSAKFAAITALIFALQMLNYPVQNGTSGHLLGAMLGVALLGIPFAVLSMSVVLAIQAFFFGDGGINALGANILNMALIGAGVLGFAYNYIKEKGLNEKVSLAAAAFISVLVGAFACSMEVAISGAVTFNKVMPAMLSVHVLIGLGEAVLTVVVVYALNACGYFSKENEYSFVAGASALAIIAAFLSPLASSFPDGLEWVAAKLSFAKFSGIEFPAMFPDYQVAFIANSAITTISAGIIGAVLVFSSTFLIGNFLKNTRTISI